MWKTLLTTLFYVLFLFSQGLCAEYYLTEEQMTELYKELENLELSLKSSEKETEQAKLSLTSLQEELQKLKELHEVSKAYSATLLEDLQKSQNDVMKLKAISQNQQKLIEQQDKALAESERSLARRKARLSLSNIVIAGLIIYNLSK